MVCASTLETLECCNQYEKYRGLFLNILMIATVDTWIISDTQSSINIFSAGQEGALLNVSSI